MNCTTTFAGVTVASIVALAGAARAQVIPATVVAKNGDAIAGAAGPTTVSTLGSPYTDSTGKVGFIVSLADSSRSIWYNTGPVFNSGSVAGLSGGETTIGISDTGTFIYSPSFNGDDAVWTGSGLLLVDGDPAPGFPGQFNSFNSRPRMAANGTAFWVAGVSNTSGGATVANAFYSNATPANPAATIALNKTGDVINGLAMQGSGVNFVYDISSDATQRINLFLLGPSGLTDAHIVLNGATVTTRESDPVPMGTGETWTSFRSVGIANSGSWIMTADTSAAAASDEVLVIDGAVALREGQSLDGLVLTGQTDAVSISDAGQFAVLWDLPSSQEGLFVGRTSSATGAKLVAKTLTQIDVDGDTVADFFINDFNASAITAPGLDLADDGFVYANVDLRTIGGVTDIEAIVRFAVPSFCDPIDFNGDGIFPDNQDITDLIEVFGGGACPTGTCQDLDFNNDGIFPDNTDIIDYIEVFGGGPC
jgi:hypothetical protein